MSCSVMYTSDFNGCDEYIHDYIDLIHSPLFRNDYDNIKLDTILALFSCLL